MSEPQLERSVLEAKEREELYAIADALGTKPSSRARKSDLILQILRATGVAVDDGAAGAASDAAGDKPRRATRARKAAASDSAQSDPAGDEAQATTGEPSGTAGSAATAQRDGSGPPAA